MDISPAFWVAGTKRICYSWWPQALSLAIIRTTGATKRFVPFLWEELHSWSAMKEAGRWMPIRGGRPQVRWWAMRPGVHKSRREGQAARSVICMEQKDVDKTQPKTVQTTVWIRCWQRGVRAGSPRCGTPDSPGRYCWMQWKYRNGQALV